MKTFIVMLRHACHDIPVAVYSGKNGIQSDVAKELAFSIAQKTRPIPTRKVREAFDVDSDSPLDVSVYEFHDGFPFTRHLVKEFE